MIYGIGSLLSAVALAVIFRELLCEDELEWYAAIVCFGAILWPVTIVVLAYHWIKWRED